MGAAQLQRLIIFLHLPKTAGSTLARIIGRQYESRAILRLYESSFGEELAAIPAARMADIRIVMGHLYFGVHGFSPRPSTYVTMLRDPVDRVISHYYFVRRDPSHYLYQEASNLSLREYVEFCGRQEPNNDQTRLLAGKCDTPPFGNCSDEMLEIAKRNLDEHFAVVGLTEEFDRSVILMKRTFGWRCPVYCRENVGPPRKERVPSDTLRAVRAHNAFDIELYRYAEERFRAQVRLEGKSFDKEIHSFCKLNRSYGQLRLLISSAIERLRRGGLTFRG